MRSDLSTFARRMEIRSLIMKEKSISQLELSRHFDVSRKTINRDIIALGDYLPIRCNAGRYGGFTLVDNYRPDKVYLSREEEAVIREFAEQTDGRKQILLQAILYKFAMPKK